MKTHMADDYLSPEVYWYGQSAQALPPSFGEGLVEDEARIQQYRDAGLHAEADRQAELVVRRKESISQQALAQYYFPMADFEAMLRRHFPTRIDPGEYQGEGDHGVPNEVLKKLAELHSQKLAALEEELLVDHQDELIFDKVKFWIADDGEVLVVASKKFGELKHWYLLAQWRPDGMPHTRPENLIERTRLEETQAAEAKVKKRRQLIAAAIIYVLFLAAYIAVMITMFMTGNGIWVAYTVFWFIMGNTWISKKLSKLVS
jgi:hypothetical protein